MRWSFDTPDGRRLVVTRESDAWEVACGEAEPERSELLDVALAKAIRAQNRTSGQAEDGLGSWTRALADSLERAAQTAEHKVLPDKGDRVELGERRFGVVLRGTVQHVDQLQILVKCDDGRSRSLRLGVDRFRIIGR
jgi:hypothetical protein